eukprot:TRINITY_DN19145_c0_g1_i1.p1 TRINITY_DN19145_c0_g1~~TRINITY_DN19145_c0_g1_i1.p1  ORF type:complete len:283 (-),score=74.72 TRINITY_DN19145_c0_g1_i1:6-797(-)
MEKKGGEARENKYEIDYQRQIGQGAFASVYACRKNDEKECNYVAKKIAKKSKYMSVLGRELENAQIMKEKRNENVLHVDDIEDMEKEIIVYTKYYKKDTLEDYMDEKGILTVGDIKDLFAGILNGLHFLHENNMVHRDMKNENVFLEMKGNKLNPVIGDLGFARNIQESMDTVIGTPITMSPELLKYEAYSSKVDIWALGAMLYKMCFCLYPFEKGDLRARVEKGDYMLKGNILATVNSLETVSYTHLRAHETSLHLVCRLLL